MKIGIVGMGYWGQKIARNLIALGANVSFCDKDPDRLEGFFESYIDFKDMLASDINAVIIATDPLSTHYDLAKESLNAGKHVWLEKPMTSTPEQAAELIKLARKKQLIINVDHTFLYSGPVKRIKQMLDSKELGYITAVHMRWLNHGIHRQDMDVIWDLCPHAFSMLNYWFGMEPEKIHKIPPYDYDDAHITLDYDAKPGTFQAHIHASWNYPQKIRECVIVGSEKMLVYDDMAMNKLIIHNRKAIFDEEKQKHIYRDSGIIIVDYEETEPLRDECEHFIECIEENKKTRSSGEDGAFVVEMLYKASDNR